MGREIVLDVRPLFDRGEEPFPTIMAAVAELGPGDALVLVVGFEPVPLYRVLAAQGFTHEAVQLGPDHWCITFRQE